MLNTVRKTIRKYKMLDKGSRVVVGISGGADSVALLLALIELRVEWDIEIYAAHVNHHLRGGDSDGDEAFARELCERLSVPFYRYNADVKGYAATEKISLEEAGRRLRYAYFGQTIEEIKKAEAAKLTEAPEQDDPLAGMTPPVYKIAVAHSLDDSAETVLLNLFRGTGLKGLCGIPPARDAVIIRPLIETTRGQIENFLRERGQPYRVDGSNADPAYTRNRVRHQILPVIKDAFGESAANRMVRGASLLRDDEDFLSQAAKEAYESCKISALSRADEKEIFLDIGKLSSLHPAILRRALREAVGAVGGLRDIGATHIKSVVSVVYGQTGKTAELPNGIRGERIYGNLKIFRVIPAHMSGSADGRPVSESGGAPRPAASAFYFALETGQPVYIPTVSKTILLTAAEPPDFGGKFPESLCTKISRYDRIKLSFVLRSRLPGDYIYLKNVGRKKIQDYFTDRKVPRDCRDKIPLLAMENDSEILWIIDGNSRINARYEPDEGEKCIFVSVY
ncbi:MAG: tRNA lysidine(34) synthetase TilS [Clostridiales bacterium]|jgi:tRNA(Ile)-lysidine synthase|nr:tRNA lysidine(34) synthetase TilS [Clostridiales bacterium]